MLRSRHHVRRFFFSDLEFFFPTSPPGACSHATGPLALVLNLTDLAPLMRHDLSDEMFGL